MFIVANRVPVAEAYREMFEERFSARAGQIEKQPGFVRMQVLQPAKPGLPYVVLTSWRDKAAFEAWVGSEDFRIAHANPMPKEAFDGEGAIEMHEVIISAEGELEHLRQRISQLVAERETLKQALESGRTSPGDGLRRLERLDRDLSVLDTDFKNLWDERQK